MPTEIKLKDPIFCEVCEDAVALTSDTNFTVCLECLVSGVEMGAI
jgi:hypothetical protein